MIVSYGELKKGATIDPHTNPGIEWAYNVQGKCEFRLNGKSFLLEAGDSVSYNATLEHSVTAIEKLKFFAIYVQEKEYTPLEIPAVHSPCKRWRSGLNPAGIILGLNPAAEQRGIISNGVKIPRVCPIYCQLRPSLKIKDFFSQNTSFTLFISWPNFSSFKQQ